MELKSYSDFGRKYFVLRTWFFYGLILIFAYLLSQLPRIAFPFLLAYVIYVSIGPLAVFIKQRLGISKNMALLMVLIVFVSLVIYPMVKLAPLLMSEVDNFQQHVPRMEGYIKDQYLIVRDYIQTKTGISVGDSVVVEVLSYVRNGVGNFVVKIPMLATMVIEWIFLAPFFLFFFIKDHRSLKQFILKLVPNNIFERFYFVTYKFQKQLAGYVLAKGLEATIVGLIISIGLWSMNVKFAFLLGIIAGVTNIIPYVGPIIGVIPAVLLGLVEYGFGSIFVGMMILYFVANAIDIFIVFPILVSKIVDLHPLLVVVSVIIGSHFGGLVGIIISIPLLAAIKLIFLEFYRDSFAAADDE